MAAVVLLVVQGVFILSAVALGAAVSIRLGPHNTPPPRAPASPTPPSITTFLPSPSSAELHDLQQGIAHLGRILARLESGTGRPHEYDEAKALAKWILDAGRAAEERLARSVEGGDERMDEETAKLVVAKCRAEGVPQRAIARITGWSKSWVATQCASSQTRKTEILGS